MTAKTKLDSEDIAIGIHTALRKACDSTPTSLMYNLVSLLEDGSWDRLYKYLFKMLEDVDMNDHDAVAKTVREAWQTHPQGRTDKIGHPRPICKSSDLALYCAANLIPDDEWAAVVAFIIEKE